MVDFAEIADLISDVVIDEGLGASVTITRTTPGAYDPATGTTAAPSTATQTIIAPVEDYKGLELVAGMQGGLIQAGDKKVSLPAASLTWAPIVGDPPPDPAPTFSITVGGLTYAIQAVSTTEAGGVAILYVCQCRRA